MRFNREAVLILDLQNGVSCTAFLNGFLSGKFKFSFVESKITALADVLRRDQDFIQVIEISDWDDFVWQDTWKGVVEDNDSQSNKHLMKDEGMAGWFHTSPQHILKEIKGCFNPELTRWGSLHCFSPREIQVFPCWKQGYHFSRCIEKGSRFCSSNRNMRWRWLRLVIYLEQFHTNAYSIPMEIKCNPMLKRAKPNETLTKFRNKNKYYDYHEDFGHITFERRKLKRGLHELADRGN